MTQSCPIIEQVDHLTFSMLLDAHGKVRVLTSLVIDANGKPEKGMLAGTAFKDGTKLTFIYIDYHVGRQTWRLVTEQADGVAMPTLRPKEGLLPDVVAWFEERVGVTLPDSKIVHLGVGLYDIKSRYTSDNVFALQDGVTYHVVNKKGVGRDLIARRLHDKTTVAILKTNGESLDFIEPSLILTREEWLSLQPVPQDQVKRTGLRM